MADTHGSFGSNSTQKMWAAFEHIAGKIICAKYCRGELHSAKVKCTKGRTVGISCSSGKEKSQTNNTMVWVGKILRLRLSIIP